MSEGLELDAAIQDRHLARYVDHLRDVDTLAPSSAGQAISAIRSTVRAATGRQIDAGPLTTATLAGDGPDPGVPGSPAWSGRGRSLAPGRHGGPAGRAVGDDGRRPGMRRSSPMSDALLRVGELVALDRAPLRGGGRRIRAAPHRPVEDGLGRRGCDAVSRTGDDEACPGVDEIGRDRRRPGIPPPAVRRCRPGPPHHYAGRMVDHPDAVRRDRHPGRIRAFSARRRCRIAGCFRRRQSRDAGGRALGRSADAGALLCGGGPPAGVPSHGFATGLPERKPTPECLGPAPVGSGLVNRPLQKRQNRPLTMFAPPTRPADTRPEPSSAEGATATRCGSPPSGHSRRC